jgi:hypothetical protein
MLDAFRPTPGATVAVMAGKTARTDVYVGMQSRGVFALPADLRKRHHLDEPGAQVRVVEREDGVIELHPQAAWICLAGGCALGGVHEVRQDVAIWDMTSSWNDPDGRATREWIEIDSEPAIRWRRVGHQRDLQGGVSIRL